MRNFCLLLASLLLSMTMNAQEAFGPIFQLSEPHPIIDNIDSIVIYTYGQSYVGGQADTVIVIEQDSLKLALQSRTVRTFPNTGVTVDTEYDISGQKKSTLTVVQDKDGMVVSQKTEFIKESLAKFMNSERVYTYEYGKIASIVEKGSEVLSLSYDKDGLPTTFNINAGFATMAMTRGPHESGYIYNAEAVPLEGEEGLLGLMGDAMNDMPKTYALLSINDDKHTYTYIEEDNESGEKLSEQTYIRNNDGLLLESLERKGSESHKKYKYSSDGELLEIHDITNDKVMTNEFDDNGNMTVKHDDFTIVKSSYDDHNNLIAEKQFWSDDASSLQSMIIRKIVYKEK